MDALSGATFVEPTTSRDDGVTAAYGAGYSDGITLLHGDGHNNFPVEPFLRTHGRYLSYAELDDPTPGERAYIDGFRDVDFASLSQDRMKAFALDILHRDEFDFL